MASQGMLQDAGGMASRYTLCKRVQRLKGTGGEQVELWDVREPVPAVRSVALMPDGAAPTAVDLGDALPLSDLLAPVGAAKEQILAALDLLQPAQPGAQLLGLCRRWYWGSTSNSKLAIKHVGLCAYWAVPILCLLYVLICGSVQHLSLSDVVRCSFKLQGMVCTMQILVGDMQCNSSVHALRLASSVLYCTKHQASLLCS